MLNTSKIKNFTVPLPLKGEYELEITKGRDVKGSTPDENGECSEGIGLTYTIAGPQDARLTDGNSAIGYSFDELLFAPRESLEKANPQIAARMTLKIQDRIKSAFGDSVPEELHGVDFEGRHINASVYTAYDKYAEAEIAKIEKTTAVR